MRHSRDAEHPGSAFPCGAWERGNRRKHQMTANQPIMPPIHERHRARRLAVSNGAVWAIGNGLACTTLIIYLAGELHAESFGLSIGLILAAPRVAGLLRLAAPTLIERFGGRKRFCLGAFVLSASVLSLLPLLCVPGRLLSPGWSLAALIGLWCVYHLLQYLGTVALYSWLADVAEVRIRGRFLGIRQRWMVGGTAAAAIAVGLFVWAMDKNCPTMPKWMPYAIAAWIGAALMFAAIVPLWLMPSMARRPAENGQNRPPRGVRRAAAAMFAPLADLRFLPLLLFGCWFSLSNGVTQSAQNFFPIRVLGLPMLVIVLLQTAMRLGQWTVSPRLGVLADRFGNRPIMIVSQLFVAGGMLFFAASAATSQPIWLVDGWVFWIAYAGLNICLPNLTLKLAPRESNAAYVAAYQALGGVCYAAGTVGGGALVDRCGSAVLAIGGATAGFFTILFVFGWIIRSLGAAILLLIDEPSAETSARSDE